MATSTAIAKAFLPLVRCSIKDAMVPNPTVPVKIANTISPVSSPALVDCVRASRNAFELADRIGVGVKSVTNCANRSQQLVIRNALQSSRLDGRWDEFVL